MHFFVKLIPPRPTFAEDMTEGERALMQQHGAYWTGLMQEGVALVFGPVLDPEGVFGIAVVAASDEQQVRALVENDPARILNTFQVHPMRAVLPGTTPGTLPGRI